MDIKKYLDGAIEFHPAFGQNLRRFSDGATTVRMHGLRQMKKQFESNTVFVTNIVDIRSGRSMRRERAIQQNRASS